MAFSYSAANVGAEGRDYARFLLGDTAAETAVLQDEEIDALLGRLSFAEAVAQAAESCVARVSQQPDEFEDEGGLKTKWTQQRVRHWNELAARMRARVVPSTTPVAAGPVSAELDADPGLESFL